jgi:hypothetical protein
MRTATIEFTGSLVVYQDDDEWEGDDMTNSEAAGWVEHCLSRGGKHAGNFTAYGAGAEDDE